MIKSPALIACLLVSCSAGIAQERDMGSPDLYTVYVGTFPSPKSKGIYMFRFDASSGTASPRVATLAIEAPKPGSLKLHPNGQFLYSANETDEYEGKPGGSASAYAIRKDGGLELLNMRASGGKGPCYVNVDPTGRSLLLAHYNGGCVSTFPLRKDGSLGEIASFIQHTGSSVDPIRQTHAYAHWIGTDFLNQHALVCDLGLDKIFIYPFDPTTAELGNSRVPFVSVRPGSGPRHLAFHPNGRWVYVINEMGNTMMVFDYDAQRGHMRQVQSISTLPAGFSGTNTCAEVLVHPNGRFVYGSNRGHNSIVVYSVDLASGTLSLVQHQATGGMTPRGMALDPAGRWLVVGNQDSDNAFVFGVNRETGRLNSTDQMIEVGSPSCFVFARPR
jgi:6-phosphogluconolactonase